MIAAEDETPGQAPRHWALVPPTRPPLPQVANDNWPRNAIDYFVLDRLQREGLPPSPEADKTTLARRVTLDLTGLPPTPVEVDRLLADDSPEAYQKLVDRLLASPRFGERMATPWLYAARYADTSGYQNDGPRTMWRWRDWVIEAFNRNMPFDQFTIEQTAGDLLPDATLAQRIATGFNRNHRGNAEGGIIPEEYAVEYVVDRVETTATVFLGLTMGCARCHDHKFDPLTQRDFYSLFAYFNNVPEFGRAIKEGNSPPYVKAPTADDQRQLAELDAKLAAAGTAFASFRPKLQAEQTAWLKTLDTAEPVNWSISDGLVLHYPLDCGAANHAPPRAPAGRGAGASESRRAGSEGSSASDLAAASPAPTFHDGQAAFVRGQIAGAADFDGKRFIDAGDVANFGYFDKFSLSAWIRPRGEHGGIVLSRMTDVAEADGYYLQLVHGKLQLNLVKRWLDDAVRVETERSLEPDRWYHVAVTYDGSRVAKGIQIYIDRKPEKLSVQLDFINQSFSTNEPLRIGGGGGPEGRFDGAIDDVRVFDRCLSADEVALVATPDSINEIAATPPNQQTPRHADKLAAYFLENHASESIRQAHRQWVALSRQRDQFVERIPTAMVMEEMPTPRDTFVLLRGVYDKHGDKVTPGVPAVLSPLPRGVPNNRLGLARWLVDPANPLTARVAVNRFWQMYFGTGLVKTVEDFGSQGEPPSHPELLDWLASEFIRSGWDIKAMQRLIVTSATYRQSSKATPALVARDPENRLLARGPRLRLSAETIRDQALAASGLLVEKLGGPSVKPYQPAGLWKEIATDSEYVQDTGENLYRRSLYTYWKRTVAPPSMITFDAAARETCVVRETRTNTPLQALTLMNDVTFVEAARMLAQRVMSEDGSTAQDRLTLAFRLVTGRSPRSAELDILLRGLGEYLAGFRANPDAARALVSAGEFPRNETLDICEQAAFAAVAGLILNLDEVVTKE
jgi:hypothetical protein